VVPARSGLLLKIWDRNGSDPHFVMVSSLLRLGV
jgi:hypothetical protein